MSLDEKQVVGAQVVPLSTPTTERPHLNLVSPSTSHLGTPCPLSASQCTTPMDEYDPTSPHPFSAFYSHPTTRTSFEQAKCESKTQIRLYEHDIESASRIRPSTEVPPAHARAKPCTVWPNRCQLNQDNSKAKGGRCVPLKNLSKKQRNWLKVLLAAIIIGAVVGLGIGISLAVGGGVWKSSTQQTQIGHRK
ncbi:hypothetical protein MMC20_006578 [Loxospora ochrophaea]|nr:hypothetical protein [Loxospora ochrophaea]